MDAEPDTKALDGNGNLFAANARSDCSVCVRSRIGGCLKARNLESLKRHKSVKRMVEFALGLAD